MSDVLTPLDKLLGPPGLPYRGAPIADTACMAYHPATGRAAVAVADPYLFTPHISANALGTFDPTDPAQLYEGGIDWELDAQGSLKEMIPRQPGLHLTSETSTVAQGLIYRPDGTLDVFCMHQMDWDLNLVRPIKLSRTPGQSDFVIDFEGDSPPGGPGLNGFTCVAPIDGGDGYCYMLYANGYRFTPGLFLARALWADLSTLANYQWWTGRTWSTHKIDQGAVLPSVGLGELSLHFNAYLGAYLLGGWDYLGRGLKLWKAAALTGPWQSCLLMDWQHEESWWKLEPVVITPDQVRRYIRKLGLHLTGNLLCRARGDVLRGRQRLWGPPYGFSSLSQLNSGSQLLGLLSLYHPYQVWVTQYDLANATWQ